MAADDDKNNGANNSGSESGVSPSSLTGLETFLTNRPPGTGGTFDGRTVAQLTPNGVLPNPVPRRNMIGFANGGTFLFSGDDEPAAPAQTYTASPEPARAVQAVTDVSRPSFTPRPVQAVQTNSNSNSTRPNLLDDYTNYTYGITLHAAKTSEYTPGTVSGEVIIVSGGHRENRNSNFYEDFYFENFKLESIIGLNAKSRSSNVITAEFTVIEPYGMTLMDRILDLSIQLGVQNWYEMLFTLQVDFYANSDAGELVNPVPGATKYFQIGLIGCDIKVGSRGAEYKFTAIPFSHHAYQQTVGTTPAMFEANGEKVGDIFADDGKGSFCKALNEYQLNLVKKEHYAKADVYKFQIDPSIAESTIVTNKDNEIKSSPMPGSESDTSAESALGQTKSGQPIPLTLNKQRFPVNAGTSIIDFINLVIRSSTYVEKQMVPGGAASEGKINWFKIVPEISYGDFDPKRNTHQKTITYHVIPYTLYNTKYTDAPTSRPPQSNWSKEYKWIYTGHNQQILDFNVDFNVMFYTMMTSDRNKIIKGEVKPNGGNDEQKEQEEKGSGNPLGAGTIGVSKKVMVAGNTPISGFQQGKNDVAKTASNDFYNSLMSSSRGDMINVNLKIAGDPDFVKQDDIYFGPTQGSGSSINMDTEEVYVNIFFKIPSDLDQNTGLMDFSSYPNSVFSGVYRVIRVESIFDRGQFIQNLDCIRLFGEGEGVQGGFNTDQRAGNNSTNDARSAAENSASQKARELMNTSGLPVRAEDGTLSNLKKNPEDGSLYDPTGRESIGRETPSQLFTGITEAEAANETRRLFNRVPPRLPTEATIDISNVNEYLSLPLAP